ncbi:tRNA (adenosine(37)-N6)-threonylcarbamoyltransferase complex transferase subunit TsaD [Oscillochloris sp. ZM17-4]|uniref:tRNA (adenosine(37)-N6)-threonylcarbamoyltransferase complex transferase subunit TsaD n=1 Tax=Oscillochloris sp. ZM17-4 TaxID=2866714 RepID=UPI001C7337BB|nr:tRNA (adenosine(37)-N6)-threonylcarbamoyltransferase complex transferase subunit TsaD [Oscillochloris sp. ZM17-4]MBX0329786.1 tRNA (adenosine(37)-N6)-threonylcarbamoyltransferase complex transferase subunit TsaD [Oscillochloris sp. ZM17-4]
MTNLPDDFTILAVETSCDETAAAVVRGGRAVLANVVASQMDMHRRYGGVVPEVASRQHILSLAPVVQEALAALPGGWADVDAIAATHGPGLSGALLTGLNAAKAMAWQRGLPFVGVNHLESHIYASWLEAGDRGQGTGDRGRDSGDPPEFPLIALVVSGGHTLLALLHGHGDYAILGQTRDDAVGEAFDKVARILGLGYPGGPAVQKAAEGAQGAPTLPRAWLRGSYDFSFSGLKTAVLHKVQERQEQNSRLTKPGPKGKGGRLEPQPSALSPQPSLDPHWVAQMAHAFQESVVDVLTAKAADVAREHGATAIILAGGVAANTRLRAELARRADVPVRFPPIALCTDNAAMVAAAAFYRFAAGAQSGWDLDVTPNLKLGAA